jgi:hypothetical protein
MDNACLSNGIPLAKAMKTVKQASVSRTQMLATTTALLATTLQPQEQVMALSREQRATASTPLTLQSHQAHTMRWAASLEVPTTANAISHSKKTALIQN